MLPTIKIENLFDSEEIDYLNRLILNVGAFDIDDGIYSESDTSSQHMANYIYWDYHKCSDIESILTPKLEKNLNLKISFLKINYTFINFRFIYKKIRERLF